MDLKIAYESLKQPVIANAKQVSADIEAIREWLLKQAGYMKSRVDEAFILKFLRTAKFSYSRTQELIRNYWMNRTQMVELFHDRNYDEDSLFMEIADLGFFVKLPHVDDEGRVLVVQRIGVWNPDKHEFKDIIKYIFTCLDVICEDERAQINGVVMIFDMSGMSSSQAANVTVQRVQNIMTCFQDMYPLRTRLINYYNSPKAFDTIFTIFKMFLKEKIKKRIKFHGSDLKSLHKEIPKKCLPKEYGGQLDQIMSINEAWVESLKTHKVMLLDLQTYGVDVAKLPVVEKDCNEFVKDSVAVSTNLSGTFRKLNID